MINFHSAYLAVVAFYEAPSFPHILYTGFEHRPAYAFLMEAVLAGPGT